MCIRDRFTIHSSFPRKLRPFPIIYVTRCYLIESISQFPLPPQTSPAAYRPCSWRDRCCCRLGCCHYPSTPSIDPYSHRPPPTRSLLWDRLIPFLHRNPQGPQTVPLSPRQSRNRFPRKLPVLRNPLLVTAMAGPRCV